MNYLLLFGLLVLAGGIGFVPTATVLVDRYLTDGALLTPLPSPRGGMLFAMTILSLTAFVGFVVVVIVLSYTLWRVDEWPVPSPVDPRLEGIG